MQFPTTYVTFTVPTGAGPGQSRIVLTANGSLISYNNSTPPGTFSAMSGGRFLWGAQVNNQIDQVHSGSLSYVQASPIDFTDIFSNTDGPRGMGSPVEIQLIPGNATTDAEVNIQSASGQGSGTQMAVNVFGNVFPNNIQTGNVSVTTVANQWVEVAINFDVPFDSIPTVLVMGQNNAPAAGGTTALYYAITGVTQSNCTLRVFRSTVITMNIGWLAITSFLS